ncbi:uridine diphosphate-N-acetylglucosamine-binding protein YvcK [Sedimentibacter sp. zth1]|uniref:gluconeogenesis factor YvcK family protein n=1 Tax=Sedimentibacter sp. zth1 TaxID=2816908 RepID=UPI001A92129B|nr:uridine diphosphate-N-acetylglucosamine-binding protein YvcK [Sedimentibacter sp. zth1]QSX05316.1 uridine diphosphate-N-acetylglucosamine-binding protein YvcK [Sedimentibacter sp. zth1]
MKIMVFGGGTGLSVLLRGLKKYTKDITAVVTVADNGGGSGILREDLGMLPPGDMRNCITALADVEPSMLKLLQHRFKDGYLQGQSFGNLLIAAMYEIFGDYEHALKEIGSIFRLSGKVLPMTLTDTHLKGQLENGVVIFGEKEIPIYSKNLQSQIDRIYLVPSHCEPLEETISDIEKADIVILGPGSLYTSVIPNLMINNISQKIYNSKCKTFYICNLMTQPGETDSFNVVDHVKAIQKHTGINIIDFVIANDQVLCESIMKKYNQQGSAQVLIDGNQIKKLEDKNIKVISSDFVDIKKDYVRHNSYKIGGLIEKYVLKKGHFKL